MTGVSYTSPLARALAGEALERFLRYVRIDTQSIRDRTRSPSTTGQLELARLLVAELLDIGLGDAELDENGYVTATLPSTVTARPAESQSLILLESMRTAPVIVPATLWVMSTEMPSA